MEAWRRTSQPCVAKGADSTALRLRVVGESVSKLTTTVELEPGVVSAVRHDRPEGYEPRARHSPAGTWTNELIIAALRDWFEERFYRTVLSVLGVEPSHADAELVEWDDWDIGPTDPEHPVTRGLHVGFRARDRDDLLSTHV
jgi:hypothetical protein